MTGKDRISLCMIVRNEARSLARCLASARPWVAEMVVVDTGSTDDTVAIAEAAGAKVHHVAWTDDFAAARNASLELATRPWALVLDADEELVVTDPDEFFRAVQQDVLDGFSFRIHNLTDDGQLSVGTVFRLFKRSRQDMRYRGEIHEQVIAVAERKAQTAALGCAHLLHDGYRAATVADKAKTERNLVLSRKLVASRPDDPFAWYALGLAQRPVDTREVVAAYERGLALWEARGETAHDNGYVASMVLGLVESLQALGQHGRAAEQLERGLALYPDSPDLRFHRAEARLRSEDFAGAAADFEACLSEAGRNFFLIQNPGVTGAPARTGLALAWINLGKAAEAEPLLELAIAEAPPAFTRAHRLLGSQLLQRGEWARALPLLERAFEGEPEEARFGLGWCRYKLERYDEAADVLQPLAEKPEVQHLLGKILLEAGRGAEALPLLDACALPPAGLARGWACYVTGQEQKAAEVWETWLRAGAADWGTKDTLATFLFLMQGGKPPSGQPERPAEPLRDMDQWFRLLLRHQRFNDVEQVLGRAPQLGKRLWWPLRKKFGVTLIQEGFYDVGLELLLAARADEPEDAELYYWLGYASLHKQHVDDARVLWEACLQLAPQHHLASQALSLLASGKAGK